MSYLLQALHAQQQQVEENLADATTIQHHHVIVTLTFTAQSSPWHPASPYPATTAPTSPVTPNASSRTLHSHLHLTAALAALSPLLHSHALLRLALCSHHLA